MTNPHAMEVLFDEHTIAQRHQGLAHNIVSSGMVEPLVVAILKGSFMFVADLLRALSTSGLRLHVEFMHLSSYREATTSSGAVTILKDVDSPVAGRDVLLVDDILESGRTLSFAKNLMLSRGAARVQVCVLLDKPGKRAVPLEADYVGFTCPDLFVVGYGMDLAHAYRELPFVGVIR